MKVSDSNLLLRELEDTQPLGRDVMAAEKQFDVGSESGLSFQKVDFFQTDTNEMEELFDSSGAEIVNNRPTLIPLNPDVTTSSEVTGQAEPEYSGGLLQLLYLIHCAPAGHSLLLVGLLCSCISQNQLLSDFLSATLQYPHRPQDNL